MSPAPGGSRLGTVVLVALALALPVGALLQPWLFPARSHLPVVERQLHTPILLVTVPGLRADRLHHLGYARPTSPSLDRLAEQGVSFPTFQANGNEAAVTLACLFTGRCPKETGVRAPGDRLPDAAATVAEQLRAADYFTAAVGSDPGFAEHGWQQGFATFLPLTGAPAGDVLDGALDLLRDAPRENAFVWADLADLLPPYGGADLDNRRFAPDAPAGFGATQDEYDLDAARLAARGWGARELSWLSARYDAALLELDAAIGDCLQRLADEGRLESMLVIVTGTRGERLDDGPAGARAFAHGCDLSEPSLHVPLLLRLPGQACRGLRPQRLAQSADLAPTLLELGAHRTWDTPQGRSLAPIVLWQQRVHKSVFAEGLVQARRDEAGWRGAVLRLENLKLLLDETGAAREAWRILEDAHEQQPLALRPEQVEVARAQASDWPASCFAR